MDQTMTRPSFYLAVLCLTLVWPASLFAATGPAKKLIEFGWDEPDTRFMREHAAEMDQTPFDGCVFHAQYTKPDGSRGDFLWECWARRAFKPEELDAALQDLQSARFTRMTNNFLRFNTAPGDVDWFDDFSAITNNARLAASFARQGHCPGLLFDIEQYNFPLFNYHKQKHAGTRSWDEYAAQVRRRGREVMEAFQDGYPGLTIFLTFGYSLPWVESGGRKEKLSEANYGLLAPFLDGLLDAAQPGTTIVDGHELSYGYKKPAQFDDAYRRMKTELLPIVADPDKYAKVFSFGFGIWMDENWRKLGWDTENLSKNYFTPDAFEASVAKALQTADDYVWVYTEQPRWWSKEGKPVKLPEAYDAALRAAKQPKRSFSGAPPTTASSPRPPRMRKAIFTSCISKAIPPRAICITSRRTPGADHFSDPIRVNGRRPTRGRLRQHSRRANGHRTSGSHSCSVEREREFPQSSRAGPAIIPISTAPEPPSNQPAISFRPRQDWTAAVPWRPMATAMSTSPGTPFPTASSPMKPIGRSSCGARKMAEPPLVRKTGSVLLGQVPVAVAE